MADAFTRAFRRSFAATVARLAPRVVPLVAATWLLVWAFGMTALQAFAVYTVLLVVVSL